MNDLERLKELTETCNLIRTIYKFLEGVSVCVLCVLCVCACVGGGRLCCGVINDIAMASKIKSPFPPAGHEVGLAFLHLFILGKKCEQRLCVCSISGLLWCSLLCRQ